MAPLELFDSEDECRQAWEALADEFGNDPVALACSQEAYNTLLQEWADKDEEGRVRDAAEFLYRTIGTEAQMFVKYIARALELKKARIESAVSEEIQL